MEKNKMEGRIFLLLCYFLIAVNSYPKHSIFHAKPQTERAVHRDIVNSEDNKHEGSTEAALLPNTLTGLSREPSVETEVVVGNNGDRDTEVHRTKLHRVNLDGAAGTENHGGETETAVVTETQNNLNDNNLDNLNRHGLGTKVITISGNKDNRDEERAAEAITNKLADTFNSPINGHPATGVSGVSLTTNKVIDTNEPILGGNHHQGAQSTQNHYVTNQMNDLQGHGNLIQLEEHHRIASFRDEAQNSNHNLYQGTSNMDHGYMTNRVGGNLLTNGRNGNQLITLNVPTGDYLNGLSLNNNNNDVLIAKLISTLRDNLNRNRDIEDPRAISQSLTSTIADTLETASNNGENPNHISLRDIVDLVNGLRGNYQTAYSNGGNVVTTSPITVTGTSIDGEGNNINHDALVGRLKSSFSNILSDLLTRNGGEATTLNGNRVVTNLQGNQLNGDLTGNRIISDRNGDRVTTVTTDLNGNRVTNTDQINNLGEEGCTETVKTTDCGLRPSNGKVVIVKQGGIDGTRNPVNTLGNIVDGSQPTFQIRLTSNGVNDGLENGRLGNHGTLTTTTTTNGDRAVGATINGVDAVEGRREELVRLAGMLNQVLRGITNNKDQEIQAIRKDAVQTLKSKKKLKAAKKIKKVQKQDKKERKSKSNLKKLKATKLNKKE